MARWLPIESNPEVMNKFLHEAGLSKKWAIADVFGLDPELLAMLEQPVLSLLLLFPINEKYNDMLKKKEPQVVSSPPKDLYYMKQTISNACGTVAMMHAIANNKEKVELDPASKLGEFFEETKDDSPDVRAEKLEAHKAISEVHDEVAKEGQTSVPSLDDKVDFHFIAFVEKNGHLYELDGRKTGPVDCGKIEGDFLSSAAAECKAYMTNDPENLHFTMCALAPASN